MSPLTRTTRLGTVTRLLDDRRLTEQAEEMLTALGAADNTAERDTVQRLLTRFADIAASLIDMCPDGDEYELAQAVPAVWLELRFAWSRCNLQIQYQTMTRGSAREGLMVCGAILGQLLESLERHLDAETMLLVNKIADDPFETARGASVRTERLFDRMSRACDGSNRAVEALLLAQDQILRISDSPLLRRELEKATQTVLDELQSGLLLAGSDLAPALEAVVLRTLGTASVRVVPQMHNIEASVQLPPDVASVLLDFSERWLHAVAETSLATSAEERAAQQRSSFVTIDMQLQIRGDDVVLTLTDDADGCVHFERNERADVARNIRWNVRQSPNEGSAVEVLCSLRKIDEYLVVRAVDGVHDGLFGVPLRAVDSIEHRNSESLILHGSRLEMRDGPSLRIVDIGEQLFASHNSESMATYVIVRTNDDRLAIRVRQIDGIRRGSVRSVPEGFENSLLRGFIQSEQRVVGVMDLSRLAQAEQAESCHA